MKRDPLKRACLIVTFTLLALLTTGIIHAQEESIVPDITGLTVPQAAAELNRVGLRLGGETAQPWVAATGFEPGRIGDQSVDPGTTLPRGSRVDIAILTTANVRIVYDDNDLTFINATGRPLDLNSLSFNSADGAKRFSGSRWRGSVDSGDCTQIWSIPRGASKPIDGCGSIFWLTTNNTAEHFWSQTSGVSAFSVVQNGNSLVTCNAAPPNSQDTPAICEFYVASGAISATETPYLYVAYTTDRFVVINTSESSWMPLFATSIQAPGVNLVIGNPDLYVDANAIGDMNRLAPAQCAMLTAPSVTDAGTPEACDLIAQGTLQQPFWSAPFEVVSATRNGERATCPAATPDRTTICVMPR